MDKEPTASENIGSSAYFQIFSPGGAGNKSKDDGLDVNHDFYFFLIRSWIIELDDLVD